MLRSGLLPCILHTLLRRGLLRYRLHTCPKLWCNPCSKCYGMGCLAAYFTHVQSCDVTLVQSAIRSALLPYILHIRTFCIYRPSHHVRTSHAGAAVDKERHVTSRQDVTCAAVDKEAVTSRHVTSRHVTSRHVRTSQVPPWTRRPSRHAPWRRMPSRHVTSRQDVRRRRGQGGRRVTSRHVTSRVDKEAVTWRHVTSRHQAPPERTMLS